MENRTFDEELIAQYLLGDLPEEEQIRVEERAFRDPQYRENIVAVENDLMDEYVRGGLSDRERRQFESRFLASSKRRQKVEFAKALTRVISESVVTEGADLSTPVRASSSWWDAFVAFWRGPHLALQVSAAAAALTLVISLSWLVAENLRLRSQLAQHQETLERQVAEQRARSEDLTTQLQREREQRERNEEVVRRLQQERVTGKPEEPTQPLFASNVASLVLWPGTARSAEERPKLVVPQAATRAQLQIRLDGEPEYQQFRVELRTRGGKEIWSQNRLRAKRLRVGWAVVVNLPASALHTDEYELALKGVGDQQEVEDFGYYYFSVLQQ
jgi:hypothetical protein